MDVICKVEELLKKRNVFVMSLTLRVMHIVYDCFVCMGDFNGHVGGHIDGIDDVHGGYGVGQKSLEEWFWSFCLENELHVFICGLG